MCRTDKRTLSNKLSIAGSWSCSAGVSSPILRFRPISPCTDPVLRPSATLPIVLSVRRALVSSFSNESHTHIRCLHGGPSVSNVMSAGLRKPFNRFLRYLSFSIEFLLRLDVTDALCAFHDI